MRYSETLRVESVDECCQSDIRAIHQFRADGGRPV